MSRGPTASSTSLSGTSRDLKARGIWRCGQCFTGWTGASEDTCSRATWVCSSLSARAQAGQLGVATSIHQVVMYLSEIKLTLITVPAMDKTIEKINEMSNKARQIYDALHLDQYL